MEVRTMLQGFIARKWGDKMFEKEIAKIVKRRAFWGAVIMALPLFGIEWIVFIIILWNMYSALSEKVGTKLKFSTIAVGFIVNIVVSIAIDALFTLLPVLGWLGTGFLVYLQFYLSGKMYIETLRKAYPNHPTQTTQQQIRYLNNNAQLENKNHIATNNYKDKVAKLTELHNAGIITHDEFVSQLSK